MEFLSLTTEAKDLDGLIAELERVKQILAAAKMMNIPDEHIKKHPEYIKYSGASEGDMKTRFSVERSK